MTTPARVKPNSVFSTITRVKPEVSISLGLFLGTVLSRIPFRSKILYHWDSVNFAYAMREFSVAKEQPHPPGYIVYVWLCRLVDTVMHDPQTTMVLISIAASALAVVALFCLGRSMFDRRIGLIVALFLATSPLFWFYGEIALPHTLDTLLVIVSAWWLYETIQGDYRYLYPAVAILAIAGGVRQQTLVFLAPLLLFALRRVGWKRFLSAGVLGAMICLAWFIPLMILSEGLSNYMRVMGEFSRRFQSTTSVFMGAGWWGVRYNVRKLAMYILYGWSIVLVPGVIHAASTIIRLWQREWPQSWGRWIFLLLWGAPALIFYIIIHMGQQGLIFVFLPALLLISAIGLARLLATRPRRLIAVMAVLVGLNTSMFCLVPEYPLGPGTQRLLTRATLGNSDRYYLDRFRTIEESFAPESTAILAANWHHVEYYLPEYTVLKWEEGRGISVSNSAGEVVAKTTELGLQLDVNGQAVVVLFDPALEHLNRTPELVCEVSLPGGGQLAYIVLGTGDQLYIYADLLGLLSGRFSQSACRPEVGH